MNAFANSNKYLSITLVVFFIGALFTGLYGCSSSSSSPPIPNPDGYYTGTATVQDRDGNELVLANLQALVQGKRIIITHFIARPDNSTPNTEVYFYDGIISNLDGDSFSGAFKIFDTGVDPVAKTIDPVTFTSDVTANFTEELIITGTLSGTGPGLGNFTLNYVSSENAEAAFAKIENITNQTWRGNFNEGPSLYRISIDNAGNMLTADGTLEPAFSECNIETGTMIPVTGTGIYKVNLVFMDCDDLDLRGVPFTGLATTKTTTDADDTMVFAISTATISAFGDFARINK
jgi:hypothetical protein